MTDLRYDPIFDRWVGVAENRLGRPFEFQQNMDRRPGLECPFCRGNEDQTPPALASYTDNGSVAARDQGDWLVRVVPNKYPAFDKATVGVVDYWAPLGWQEHQSRRLNQGQQEVIVLSPRHVTSISELTESELITSFRAFQHRLTCYEQMTQIQHRCLFMNCRPWAGASIEHVHFQLIGTPICTSHVRKQYERMMQSAKNFEGSVWQQMLDFEIRQETRVLELTDHFAMICPFASRMAYQIRIVPLNESPTFTHLEASPRDELARRCQHWISRLEQCVDRPAYNIVFYFPPSDLDGQPWFVDIVPRLSRAAGFELVTDCWVNPTAPETAAAHLRGSTDSK